MAEVDYKLCHACSTLKPTSDFNISRVKKDGLQTQCKICHSASRKKWYQNNKSYHKDLRDSWYQANKEYKLRKNSEWSKRKVIESPEYFRKKQSRRRASLANACVGFTDKEKINAIYQEARDLELSDGIPRHVDHIVPLRGKNVCGLHVHWNLEILTAKDNHTKSNKMCSPKQSRIAIHD